jgi:leukotriene-A4 hydrolase
VSTYANLLEVRTDHIKLDFAVDFDRQVFDGHVILAMRTVEHYVHKVILDSVGMDIKKVEYYKGHHTNVKEWHELKHKLNTPNPNLGNALEIYLKHKHAKDIEFQLKITYTTNNETTAISWLTPA